MGASGRTWLTCRMEEQYYSELELYKHPEVQIVSIEPEYDYSHDAEWIEFDKEARRAYKAKKDRENRIRNEETKIKCNFCNSVKLEYCGSDEYSCEDCGHFPITKNKQQ